MIKKAKEFAAKAHAGQFRKGTDRPYVEHVFAVGDILENAGYPEEVVVAGILHDVVEDTDCTYEDIEKEFGKAVADIVDGVSEVKGGPWKERKINYIAHLTDENTPFESVIVSAADKFHNLTDTYEEWLGIGDAVFAKFNAKKESQSWWYRNMSKIFREKGLIDVADCIDKMLVDMGM